MSKFWNSTWTFAKIEHAFGKAITDFWMDWLCGLYFHKTLNWKENGIRDLGLKLCLNMHFDRRDWIDLSGLLLLYDLVHWLRTLKILKVCETKWLNKMHRVMLTFANPCTLLRWIRLPTFAFQIKKKRQT